MKKVNKNASNGVWDYLEKSGVLDTGSGEDIAQKRKEYWNMQKRISNHEKRKTEKECKVYFTESELKMLTKASKNYGMSRAKYFKLAVLAYSSKSFLIPNQASVNQIAQLLSLNYSLLKDLAEGMQSIQVELLIQKMKELENNILKALCNPKEILNKNDY